MQDLHLAQEYETPADRPLYLAHVHYRTEDGPMGPDAVARAAGMGDTPESATKDALATMRRVAKDEGRITILSLHIARNRLKFFAAPMDLEEVLAQEKEAADAHD